MNNNRIQSEFEAILLDLSSNPSTTYSDAYKSAEKYVVDFVKKKNLNDAEKSEMMELCLDMISDWYPDVGYVGLEASF